jgi:hypothetical protein
MKIRYEYVVRVPDNDQPNSRVWYDGKSSDGDIYSIDDIVPFDNYSDAEDAYQNWVNDPIWRARKNFMSRLKIFTRAIVVSEWEEYNGQDKS